RGRFSRLKTGMQHAARLDQHERTDQIRIVLSHTERDMSAPGMTEQMDGSCLQRGNKSRDVLRVLLCGEIVTIAVPALRPAMPEADGNRPVMRPEWRHLLGPPAEICDRTMHKKQRCAAPLLNEHHVVSVHSQGRHKHSPRLFPWNRSLLSSRFGILTPRSVQITRRRPGPALPNSLAILDGGNGLSHSIVISNIKISIGKSGENCTRASEGRTR